MIFANKLLNCTSTYLPSLNTRLAECLNRLFIWGAFFRHCTTSLTTLSSATTHQHWEGNESCCWCHHSPSLQSRCRPLLTSTGPWLVQSWHSGWLSLSGCHTAATPLWNFNSIQGLPSSQCRVCHHYITFYLALYDCLHYSGLKSVKAEGWCV